MQFQFSRIPVKWIGTAVVILVVAIGAMTYRDWSPRLRDIVNGTVTLFRGESSKSENDDESAHSQTAHAHDDSSSLAVSPQARRNIGLTDDLIRPVELTTFWKTVTIPGTVVERHGKTHLEITAPMTGVVTGIYLEQGEAVAGPVVTGSNLSDEQFPVLFKLRLTHEDLVKTQTSFLQTLGELKVVEKDITRLQKLNPALVPMKLRDRMYEKQKLEVIVNAQSEGLLLHGLSAAQVESIRNSGKLIREVLVRLPSINRDGSLRHHSTDLPPIPGTIKVQPVKAIVAQPKSSPSALIVDDLKVVKGQLVKAGQTLCVLSDYRDLFVEGQAFEHDAKDIEEAAKNGWHVALLSEQQTAVFGRTSEFNKPKMLVDFDVLDSAFGTTAFAVSRTPILNFENRIDLVSRSLHFYIRLRNRIVNETVTKDGRRYIDWRFKPGQRMQLRVPVQAWENRFVLPVDAVAQEGAEYYVFQQNGDHFDRKPVHIEYQDQYQVVIANDGSLQRGDVIAFAGAHQMQIALKNKAGGGVDPHAGHTH